MASPLRPTLGNPLQLAQVKDHPFRAINSCQNFEGNPDDQDTPTPIRLVTGNVGRIVTFNPERNFFYVINIDQPEYMNRGWVHGTDIEISDANVNNPCTVIDGPAPLPKSKDIQIPSQVTSSGDQITRGVKGFLTAVDIEKAGSLAPVLPDWWIELTGQQGEHIDGLTDKIVGGIETAKLRDVLNKPDFSWQDLLSAGDEITPTSHMLKGGVYARIYWEIEGRPDEVYIYVGQSMDMSSRFKGHRADSLNQKSDMYNSEHYRTFRAAKKYKSVALCVLEGDRNKWRARIMVEQLFICLLDTYQDYILTYAFKTMSKDLDEVVKEFSHSFGNKETGQLFIALTSAVQKKTGWPGGCSRESFGIDYDWGLNISSPCTEAESHNGYHERVLWIKSKAFDPEIGETIINYRKSTPQNARYSVNEHGTYVFSLKGTDYFGGDRHLKFVFNKDQGGPPPNATVQVVFEFLEDPRKRHPRCYARLPGVGCFHDWSYANSFAFRCEWKDKDGKTKVAYLQRKDELVVEMEAKKVGDSGFGSLSSYAWGIALWRYFNRVTPTDFRDWDIKFGLARTREVTADYFTQIITFSAELPPATGTPPSNERRLDDRMAQEMTAAGLTGAGQGWQAFPPGDNSTSTRGKGGRPRTKCDSCFLNDSSKTAKCERLEGTDDCKSCRIYLGRPCSWTSVTKLRPGAPDYEQRYAALRPPPLHNLGNEDAGIDTRTWNPEIGPGDEDSS